MKAKSLILTVAAALSLAGFSTAVAASVSGSTVSTAKTGLDKPALSVVVKFDEGKKEDRATFAQVGNDVFVSRPGEPGAAKIDAADFNDVIKSLDEISK